MNNRQTTVDALKPANHSIRERDGQWLMIFGGILLGTIGIFVQEANQHPLLSVWFRCLFGALALLLLLLISGRQKELLLNRRGYRIAIITGILMVSNWALFFAAMSKTSIAVATVVFHIQPFWVMLFGVIFLHELVSRVQLLATLLALFGLTLATGLFSESLSVNTMGDDYVIGILFCLGGSLSYAAVTVIAKTERQVTSFALAWWQCVVGIVILAWTPQIFGWPQQASSWAWLAGLGVFHTGLAYMILFAGMARLSLGNIALLQFVYPLTAVIVDWMVYGRILQPVQMIGVALMALALWAIKTPWRKKVRKY
jgi:drug/metabolite transporter (DMT)-like permease